MCHHSSHSTLSGDPVMSRHAASPAEGDGLLEFPAPVISNGSRSAILTMDEDYWLKR